MTILLGIPDPEIDTAQPGPAEVYAALWLAALRVAAGKLSDPLPPEIDELALAYFELFAPAAKA